ncbi:MAG: PEP-CTERM sorting domain-containing protein [Fimbriimonadales bacterium]
MRLVFGVTLAFAASLSSATILAKWDFNSYPSDGSSTTGTLTPVVGWGYASRVGSVTSTYARGANDNVAMGYGEMPNVLIDPEDAVNNNSGWNLSNFAAQGVGSGTRGAEFLVSTAGYTDIRVSFAMRLSNTASRYWRLDYTLDGSSWLTKEYFDHNFCYLWGADKTPWYDHFVDFTQIEGAANNPNFGIRILAVFQDEATGVGDALYIAHSPGSSYTTGGTGRFDLVTFEGREPVPEPATMTALALGVGALAWRRRRR